METSDPLYQEFLRELNALERFRVSYGAMRPRAGLLGDDPDVRRLIEALALFSARARRAAGRSIDHSIRRIFQQHFSYLCDPMPGMAMLTALPGRRMADPAYLPAGSRIVARARGRQPTDEPARPVVFTTLSGLRILPMQLAEVAIFRRPAGTYRLIWRLQSEHFRNDDIGELTLQVNYLGDLMASLQLLAEIQHCQLGAGVIFGEHEKSQDDGAPIRLRVGVRPEAEPGAQAFVHPIQRVRSVFHFPQQALCMHFGVDEQPRNWQTFMLYVDLDSSFMVPQQLTRDSFALYAVPIANLARAHTDVVVEDGTRDRHRLTHPDASGRFVLHSLRGAYRIGEEALQPLQPGVLDEVDNSYELEYEHGAEQRTAYLRANIAEAFVAPARLTVEAMWHQPGLVSEVLAEADAGPLDRTVEGARWALMGRGVGPVDNLAVSERAGLLQLLSVKNQRFLDLANLSLLLRAVIPPGQRGFTELSAAIGEVRVNAKPYGRGSRGFKYIYLLEMTALEPGQLPLLDLFATQLLSLLTSWSIEEVVELRLRVPNLEVERCYP